MQKKTSYFPNESARWGRAGSPGGAAKPGPQGTVCAAPLGDEPPPPGLGSQSRPAHPTRANSGPDLLSADSGDSVVSFACK
jgi:hypothetical protein